MNKNAHADTVVIDDSMKVELERQSRLVGSELDIASEPFWQRYLPQEPDSQQRYELLIERIRTLATQLSNAGMHTAAEWTRALLDT